MARTIGLEGKRWEFFIARIGFKSPDHVQGPRLAAGFHICFILLFVPAVQAEDSDALTAIKKTALNYMDSWYTGDPQRMKQCLHKKLAKRSLQESVSGKKLLQVTSRSDMIWYTRGGYGENLAQENLKIEVVVLDYYQDIASVKVITPHYYEYLHLIKIDNKWVIINALYERNSPTIN